MAQILQTEQPGQLPRVLILSDQIPETSTAGGLLLYRLFQGYPPERACLISRPLDSGVARLPFHYEILHTPWLRLERSRFNRWKRSLRAFKLAPVASPRQVENLLTGFQPDVVLTVMQFSRYYDCAYHYAKAHKLPLITIVHDVNEEFEKVFPWAISAFRRRDKAFYQYCSYRLCVSPEMEELCAELYGVHGNVLYPNRSGELLPRAPEEALQLKSIDKLTLGFVGNLNYGYGPELVKMLPILRHTGSRLIIFSHPPGPEASALLEAPDCCDFRGFVPSLQAWEGIKRECDAVLLSYPNPAGQMERLYRHHFPSKLPEYLALGMPVVITGPEYATGVRWGLNNPDAAMVFTSQNVTDFAAIINRLKESSQLRISLAQGAMKAGNRDFDPIKIRKDFLGYLQLAADKAR